MYRNGIAGVVGLLVLHVTAALAQDIHGRIEIQDVFATEDTNSLSALLGERTRQDLLGDVRLTWEPHWDRWSFMLHYELSADTGDTPTLTARRAALRVFPTPPPLTWWNLSDTFISNAHVLATERIDRLAVGYADAHLVLRIGRQALTWGDGLVFRPMDLFDPFAPYATDTEFKPGTDMAYAQWLFDDGSDLQFVAVPRPARTGGEPTSNASSFALHFNTAIGPLQTTWLLSRDHSDWVAGIGVHGTLGEASWNAEIIPTFVHDQSSLPPELANILAEIENATPPFGNAGIIPAVVHDGPTLTSGLANISDGTTLFGRDVTLFAEYYRNGFGLAARRYALIDLPEPLLDHLTRGQVFDTGRDYLAAGAMLQCTALLQVNPTLIANLDDGGLYGLVQGTYSLRENLNLVAGTEFPIGPSGTEFGGIPLVPHVPFYVDQPLLLYVELRQYF